MSYVCLFYAIIDTKKHMLYYANAGQPMPVCLRGDTVTELSVYGTPAGLLRDTVYEFSNMRCEPGDLIYMYTDGLIDNCYRQNPEIFMAKLIKLLKEIGQTAPLPELLDVFEHNFTDEGLSESERFQLDDVSMVAIRL
jgi:sigma-B regulation protein RsbU (phosphoserine phosphatase)